MKKHLMILGDVRVGDCFHIGTYLNKLKGEYRTTWVHGPYEAAAVDFLRDHTDLGIEMTIRKPTTCATVPMDLNSIRSFIVKYQTEAQVDRRGWDKITEVSDPIFFEKGDPIFFKCKDLPGSCRGGDFITTHFSSISDWKQHPFLFKMNFPMVSYGLGTDKNQVNENSISFANKPLDEVASLMLRSRVFVGIHSSMACLAFHLGVPMITCHFWGGENLLHFSKYRDNCIDIMSPTEEKVLAAINELLAFPKFAFTQGVIR